MDRLNNSLNNQKNINIKKSNKTKTFKKMFRPVFVLSIETTS